MAKVSAKAKMAAVRAGKTAGKKVGTKPVVGKPTFQKGKKPTWPKKAK